LPDFFQAQLLPRVPATTSNYFCLQVINVLIITKILFFYEICPSVSIVAGLKGSMIEKQLWFTLFEVIVIKKMEGFV